MKRFAIMMTAASLFAAPFIAHAQNVPPTSQTPMDSQPTDAAPTEAAPAGAPSAQTVKPMAGDVLYDKVGEQIGTVSTSNDQQVVVTTEQGKITIPVASIFTGTKGLAINMTKSEVDAAIKSAH